MEKPKRKTTKVDQLELLFSHRLLESHLDELWDYIDHQEGIIKEMVKAAEDFLNPKVGPEKFDRFDNAIQRAKEAIK